MSYADFGYGSVGTADGQISSFALIELPVRATDNPANLYIRIAGIAQAVRDDPPWSEDRPVARGLLTVSTDVVFEADDVLIASCTTAGFARIDRDENGLGVSDDFGFAIDNIASTELADGRCSIVVRAGMQGDTEIRAFSFSADLLILRPNLVASSAAPGSARTLVSKNARAMPYLDMIKTKTEQAKAPMPEFGDVADVPLFAHGESRPEIVIVSERIRSDPTLWRVKLTPAHGRLLTGLPGLAQYEIVRADQQRFAQRNARHLPHRPEWLSKSYLPRVAPRASQVFADHNRQLSRDYPWCTIGRVFYSRSGTNFARNSAGTGVLVGPNLLLTASHLAPWGAAPGEWWMEFVPAYAYAGDRTQTEPFGSSYVESFHGVPHYDGDVDGLDAVICKLYTPLGQRCGWMGSVSTGNEDFYTGSDWTSVGYPETFFGGEWPAVEFARGIKDIDDEDLGGLALETVSFTDHGWSGGPLWGFLAGNPMVVGVCSGTEINLGPDRSVFAGGNYLTDLVKYGFAHYG